jgi:hypothetical protein
MAQGLRQPVRMPPQSQAGRDNNEYPQNPPNPKERSYESAHRLRALSNAVLERYSSGQRIG